MPPRRVIVGSALLMCGLSFALAQQQTLVIPDNLFTQAGVSFEPDPAGNPRLR